MGISCDALNTVLKADDRMVVGVLAVYPSDRAADWELRSLLLPSNTREDVP